MQRKGEDSLSVEVRLNMNPSVLIELWHILPKYFISYPLQHIYLIQMLKLLLGEDYKSQVEKIK